MRYTLSTKEKDLASTKTLLNDASDQLSNKVKLCHDLDKTIESLKADKILLENRLNKDKSDFEQEISKFQGKLTNFSELHSNDQNELSEKKKELDEKLGRIEDLQTELSALHEKFTGVQRENQKSQRSQEMLSSDLATVKENLRVANNDNDSMKEVVKNKESELDH
jgi:chromosome segregation protein